MTLKDLLKALDYKISGGSDYQWDCFGINARFLDFESDYGTASVVFDSENQTIYVAEVWVKGYDNNNSPYRWFNPDYKDAYTAEAKQRKVKWRKAYDDVKFIDLELAEDFFEKASAIMNGVDFDKRILVPLNLDDDLMLELCMQAHKRDITLNQLVEEILTTLIEQDKHD
jgi:hypothetical protein